MYVCMCTDSTGKLAPFHLDVFTFLPVNYQTPLTHLAILKVTATSISVRVSRVWCVYKHTDYRPQRLPLPW